MKLAAIDIGSNSIKLVVVAAETSTSFTVVASEREVVRLGQETLVKKHIGDEAMRRALDCLTRFHSLANEHGAEQIVAIATASVREANNADEFLRRVEEKTGLRVEVLSGIEEARLIGLAASQGCTPTGSTSLNIDIGGGSTEISIFRAAEPVMLRSIQLGAVGLTDRFIRSDPPQANELNDLRSEIQALLAGPASELRKETWNYVTATSGTAVTIGAALSHIMPPATTVISLADLKQLNAMLAAQTIAERRKAVSLAPQRADIIVAGGLVLEEVMNALGIAAVNTCDWSLREGVIIDRLRTIDRLRQSTQ